MKPLVLGLVVLACMVSRPASAESILFTGTGAGASSVTLNASAFFDISGSVLTITLSNLGDSSGKLASTDIAANQLSGLFFDIIPNITLTPVSAVVDPSSIVQGSSCSPSCTSSTTNVGGEFRYATGSYPNSADRGISSGGQTGPTLNFGGSNLDGAANVSVAGASFLVIAPQTANNTFNPNSTLTGKPLIEGSVEFALNISGGTLHASDLRNVSFQYGTGGTDPNIAGTKSGSVPEPATAFLAVAGIAIAMKRRVQLRERRS